MWSTPLPWLALTLLGLFVATTTTRRRRHFPPGPPGLPLLKNVLDVPQDNPWVVYQEWSRKYKSPIVHMEVLGSHVYIISSAEVAKEIFERRSRIYSDKKQGVMICELTGWNKSFGTMPYGDWWRIHRKMFNQHFRAASIQKYHPKMLNQAQTLVTRLGETPEDFFKHIRYMAGALILGVLYGLDIKSRDDRALTVAEEAVHAFSETADAGSYLVDYLPFLKHIPAWFPGAEFKRQAARWKATVDDMFDVPYKLTKNAMSAGSANPCVATALLSAYNDDRGAYDMEEVIRNVTGVAYAGGSDTTVLTLQSFVLAMITHPHVQRAAQKQLDFVVGRGRFPTFDDRDSLPHITAVLNEVLRWRPPLPLALPHSSTADDTYEGYFIPSGSMMIGNAWAILHDESRYPNPDNFDPSRFLTEDGQLDRSVPDPIEAFGFGRRICPGRHFVTDAAWIAIAYLLSAFSIEKPVDDAGNVVEPSGEYLPGTFSWPKPFRAVFKQRSSEQH